MGTNDPSLDRLRACVGRYEGRGINHEQQRFTGRLELSAPEGREAVRVQYSATGDDDTVYHREETLIALRDGELKLETTSTNHQGMLRYALRRTEADEGLAFTFGLGDPQDASAFRSEIRVTLHEGGDVSYAHAWGLPGAEFDDRSGARMARAG